MTRTQGKEEDFLEAASDNDPHQNHITQRD